MAKIIEFKIGPRSHAKTLSKADHQSGRPKIIRAEAAELVLRAAGLLTQLGPTEQRVGWLLEDCLLLLREVASDELPTCPLTDRG